MSTRIERIPHEHVTELRLVGERANALGSSTLADLRAALADAAEDASLGVCISGGPKVFCAGADLGELSSAGPADIDALDDAFWGLFGEVAGFPKPIVAAMAGHAHGAGAVLATLCDARVSSDAATIRFNQVAIGLDPQPFLVRALRRLVGVQDASTLLLTAGRFEAAQARAMGFIDQICADPCEGALAWLGRLGRGRAMLRARAELRSDLVRDTGDPQLRGLPFREQLARPEVVARIRAATEGRRSAGS